MNMGRLNSIAFVCEMFAKDMKRGNRRERKASWILLALVHAIQSDGLDSLAKLIAAWAREQVAATDALTDGAAHDRLSEAVGEMGLPDEDVDDAARLTGHGLTLPGLTLPGSYSGLGD